MSAPVLILHDGATGALVRLLQDRMGAPSPSLCASSVKAWQAAHGLAADGAVGPNTLRSFGLVAELGVDVNGAKGPVNWPRVAAFGVEHVSLKCSEGLTFNDPRFLTNIIAAQAVELQVRAYHYARPNNNVDLEARHALQCAGAVPLDLDLETTGDLSPSALGAWSLKFLQIVAAAQGEAQYLYLNEDFWLHRLDQYARDAIADQFRLWIAAPGRAQPQPSFPHFEAHQFSWVGEVPGIAGNVDMDWIISSCGV